MYLGFSFLQINLFILITDDPAIVVKSHGKERFHFTSLMEMENGNIKMLILNDKMTVKISEGDLKEEDFKMKKEIIGQD